MSIMSNPSNDNVRSAQAVKKAWKRAVDTQAFNDLFALYDENAAFFATLNDDWVHDRESREGYFVENQRRLQGVDFHDDGCVIEEVDGSVTISGAYVFRGEDEEGHSVATEATYAFNVVAGKIRTHVSRPIVSDRDAGTIYEQDVRPELEAA